MNVNHTVRETGNTRPTPCGDFDGTTRVDALKALLKKSETTATGRFKDSRVAVWFLTKTGAVRAMVSL